MKRLLHPGTLVAARVVLGAIFVYLGLVKAVDPVAFLKQVRQFDVIQTSLLLNLTAATVPWFEVFCGVLLLAGVKVRAAALLQLVMLAAFTLVVTLRALAMQENSSIPFCSIHFDCGCGTGDVFVCMKLVENTAMMLLSGFVVVKEPTRLRPS